MRFHVALFFTLALTSGCDFDKSALQSTGFQDSGVADSLPDASREDAPNDSGADVSNSDSQQDSIVSDASQTDADLTDSGQTDSLQQDTGVDPCQTSPPCNDHGICPSGTCMCYTGYDPATNCSSCAFGYASYPSCTVTVPTITNLNVDCSSTGGCKSGNTYPVTWDFTNATTFSASLTWESGSMSSLGKLQTTTGSPIALGAPYPLPTTTTNTVTQHTINWIMDGAGEKYVRISITVTGPGVSPLPAYKSVHVLY